MSIDIRYISLPSMTELSKDAIEIQNALVNNPRSSSIKKLIAIRRDHTTFLLKKKFIDYIELVLEENNTSIGSMIMVSNIHSLNFNMFTNNANNWVSHVTLEQLIKFLHRFLTGKVAILVRDKHQQEEQIMVNTKVNIILPEKLSLTELKIQKRVIKFVEDKKYEVKGYIRHGLGYKFKGEERYRLHNSTVKYFSRIFKLNNIDITEIFREAGIPATNINAFARDRTVRHTISTDNLDKFIDYIPKFMIKPESEIEWKTEDSDKIINTNVDMETISESNNSNNKDKQMIATLTHPQGRTLDIKVNSIEEKKLIEEFYTSSMEYLEVNTKMQTIENILRNICN